jgi:hypothetical protein
MNSDSDIDCYFLECDPKTNQPYVCDNTFYTNGDETHSNIFKKTIDSISFFDPNKYDYIVRTNLSSVYIFSELKHHVSTLKTHDVYTGVIGTHDSIKFVSGSGMIMTPDVANILTRIKDSDHDIDAADDVMIGYILNKYGIQPSLSPRLDIGSINTVMEYKTDQTLFKEHVHYRLKCTSSVYDELYIRTEVMKLKTVTPILVKFPTRRIELCASTIQKYISMASNINNIRFIVSIDNDQSEHVSYLESIHPSISVFVGEAKGKVHAINRDMPPSSSFSIILLASDDMIPVVKGYDEIIIDSMKQFYPDTDGVLFFNDGFQENRLNTLVICGSKYYDRFGYIYNPEYKSLFCDNEFTDVSQRLKKQTYLHQVIIRHEHPYNLHLDNDMLYKINDSFTDYDRAVYHRRRSTYQISILICTLPERRVQLEELLKDLETLKNNSILNIEILTDDRTDVTTGEKRNSLLKRANGIYSAFVDDDDKLTVEYFNVIEAAIKSGTYDCISLNGRYYEHGIFKGPFHHSLNYSRWFDDDYGYYRPPNHLNPINTQICKQILYKDITYKEDIDFSTRLFESGLLRSEYTHDKCQYLYYSVPKTDYVSNPKIVKRASVRKTVFSFSFFGKVNRYLHGLIENCKNINKLYPDAWVYIYASRDFDVNILLKAVKPYKNIRICWIDKFEETLVQYMCHRFFAIDDDDVDVMFSRDCDSEINERDQYCINHFMKSSKKFQIIRDNVGHCKLICGGMWGAKKGALQFKIRDKFNTYNFSHKTDENFLGDCIYQHIKNDCEVFDEFFNFTGENPQKIPIDLPLFQGVRDFVGNQVYFMTQLGTVITYTDNPSLIPRFVDRWNSVYPNIDIVVVFISDSVPTHITSYSKYIQLEPACTNPEYTCALKASTVKRYEGVLITDISNVHNINILNYICNISENSVVGLPNNSYITLPHTWKNILNDFVQPREPDLRTINVINLSENAINSTIQYDRKGFCSMINMIIDICVEHYLANNNYDVLIKDNQVLSLFNTIYTIPKSMRDYIKIDKVEWAINKILNNTACNEVVKFNAHTIANIENLQLKNKIFNNILQIKSENITMFENIRTQLNINNNTLGVHIRGTDKVVELPAIDINNVFDKIDYMLTLYDISNIFISTDDMKYLNPLICRYGSRICYNNVIRSNNSEPIHFDYTARNQLNSEVLSDTYILSKCKYFIYCFSNVSLLALTMGVNNFEKIMCISV